MDQTNIPRLVEDALNRTDKVVSPIATSLELFCKRIDDLIDLVVSLNASTRQNNQQIESWIKSNCTLQGTNVTVEQAVSSLARVVVQRNQSIDARVAPLLPLLEQVKLIFAYKSR